MALRIWHQSMTVLGDFPTYEAALQKHLRRVVDDDTEVVLHGVRPGTYGSLPPVDALFYPLAFHTLLSQVIDHAAQAQADGFDAIALASYTEPFLRQLRAAVDIPVASMGESTLLVACSVARRSAIVTVSPEIGWMAEGIVRDHQLEPRLAGVYSLQPAMNEHALVAAFEEPEEFRSAFDAAAHAAIADHADVIIPGEGVLNELLFSLGVRELEGVSVMDSVAVTVLHAEMLAKLQRRTGLHAGRRWEYPKLDVETTALLHSGEG